MKKIRLMAIGLMLLLIQGMFAVTLPSSSYKPYETESSYTSTVTGISGGFSVNGSYKSLGAFVPGQCYPLSETSYSTCEDCCEDATGYKTCAEACTTDECIEECASSSGLRACTNECENGPSLPLDGGLSFLLIMALGSGAVGTLRKK